MLMLTVVLAALAVLVALANWLWPRSPRGPTVPTFEGQLGEQRQNVAFIEFLGRNERRRVYIDSTLPGDAASTGNGPFLAAATFTLTAATEPGDGRADTHEINLRVDYLKDSPLTYAHGMWSLRGHFVVEAQAGVWQGVSVRNLIPIPLADVAE